MRFRFDTISFFIGMVSATLIWWMLTLMRPMLERILELVRNRQKENAQKKISGLEGAYLKAIYKQTQEMHIASSLFSLDEIVQTPRLLAPPMVFEPNSHHYHLDITEQAVPYLPEFPELGAFYNSPALTLSQALSGGSNIVLIGQPGTGKTTALAYLASIIAKKTNSDKSLHGFIPFLIHVADLGLPLNNPKKPQDFLQPIIEKIVQGMGVFESRGILQFIEHIFVNGQALLLLDGMDEIPQPAIQNVTAYIRVILRQYPGTRMIITASPEYIDGILPLGFTPLSIMPWNKTDQTNFLQIWSHLWQEHVYNENWFQQAHIPIDTTLINRWLTDDNLGLTPMEFTLKVWGAYAGDIASGKLTDTIESHISRLLPADVTIDAVSMLAYQATLNETSIFDERRAWEWIKSFDSAEHTKISLNGGSTIHADSLNLEANPETSPPEEQPTDLRISSANVLSHQTNKSNFISSLVNSGLLVHHADNMHRFGHPVLLGYLSGRFSKSSRVNTQTIMHQSAWSAQTNYFRYLTIFDDVTDLVNGLLSKEDPILYRPIFTAARLLRDSNQIPKATWRELVITSLLEILRDDDNAIGLRGKSMVALALSGEPGIDALFRQLLQAPSNELRQLAALGAGLIRDQKAIDSLISIIDTSLESTRQAACLALVEIGTQKSLEAVAVNLLRGDEQLRIYAAEALANHLKDGHEALREGIKSNDILLRRAAVYGLARVEESWSSELLEDVQLNDEQWAVRNVAVEFLQARQKPNPRTPEKGLSPHQTPWLIEVAGKYGMGMIPGQPSIDILLLALKDSNREFFKPALSILRNSPTDGVLAGLYPHLFGTDPELKEAVFQTLSYIALGGTPLPQPRQFGLG